MLPRRFALVRHVDYTGVSGVGVVAYGVVFGDGQVALRWASPHPATSLWTSLDDLLAVHGHGDATSIEWLDPAADPFTRADRTPEPATVSEPGPVRGLIVDPSAPTPAQPPESRARTHVTGRRARPVAVDSPSLARRASTSRPDTEGGASVVTTSHPPDAVSEVQDAGEAAVPPPPPPDAPGGRLPHSRLPGQRGAGRHRRAAPDQDDPVSNQPIERDRS